MTQTRMAWEVAMEDTPDQLVTDAARSWLKSGEPKWPSPAALLAKAAPPATVGDEAAWELIRSNSRAGCYSLPADPIHVRAWYRMGSSSRFREMLTADADRTRREWLAACRSIRETPPAPALVIPMTEPKRLAEHLPPADVTQERAREFTRQVFAYKPIGAVRTPDPSARRNEQGGLKAVTPAPLRAPVNEAELRERAERQADAIRARVAK
jgi:hypothetical protein